jgi:hypothetical protein
LLYREEVSQKRIRMRSAKERVDVKIDSTKGVYGILHSSIDKYAINPVLAPISESLGRQYASVRKKIKRNMRQAKEVAAVRVHKFYLKLNGHFDEIQKELKYEIYKQYMDHHVLVAKEKARREFSVIESGKLF